LRRHDQLHEVSAVAGIKWVLIDFGGNGLSQEELVACAAAMTRQLQEQLALPSPHGWGIPGTMRAAAGPTDLAPDEWVMGLLAHADQPGALGYHDKTPHGQPFCKVFPLLDAQDGAAWTQTVSHEAIETMCDPEANVIIQSLDGTLYAAEQSDACEAGIVTVDGVALSDFLLPPWYGTGGGPCNWLNTLQPGEIGPGGYAQRLDPTQGWIQMQHASVAPRPYRQRASGRAARRRARARPLMP
jgi:hypothetical protein